MLSTRSMIDRDHSDRLIFLFNFLSFTIIFLNHVRNANLLQIEFILRSIHVVVSVAIDVVEIHVLFHPESLTSILVLDVVSLDEKFPFVPRKLVVLVKVVSFEHGLCDPFCDGKDWLWFLLILRAGI